MAFWKRRASQRFEFDDLGVRRLRGDEVTEQVTWSDLVAVDVVTTDQGPWADDLFFVLEGVAANGVIVPSGRAPDGFLQRLQQLPGFDNEATIHAATSTENARFRCWPASDS